MIWTLLLFHLGVGTVLAATAPRLGGRSFWLAALPPTATAIWSATLIGSTTTPRAHAVWVESLDLHFHFEVDALATLMTLLISGIGALVFLYSSGYFNSDDPTSQRFAATLLSFSTAMLGLAWADSVWTLFIFWELTSVTSFLLIGHKHATPSVQQAARRALMITGIGGLLLLAGLLVLADLAGTTMLSELEPVSGTGAGVAAALIMTAAATKSAQFPFHVWLPGAMAAPTPVSAYLHSATMVKAGVLLVAVVGPALAQDEVWKYTGLAFGICSMLWGGIGALRQQDAKLILAWGTVSQLGLLITLLSLGSAKATFAGIAILFAHGLFKAALFLVVGEVDLRAGTRNIAELSGLRRSMPVAFSVAAAAAASMAGIPPLLGFTAKEAAIEAVLGLEGLERAVVGAAVIGGSVLTVAYSVRFIVGVFGGSSSTDVSHPSAATALPSVVLAVAGIVGFAFAGYSTAIIEPAATQLDAAASVYSLIRWPGFTDALLISAGVVALGSVLGLLAIRLDNGDAPDPSGARVADNSIDRLLTGARTITGRVQHGSLPVYLATMAAVAVGAALPFVAEIEFGFLTAWDHPLQAVLGGAIVAAAVGGALVQSRLGAALALGGIGTGVSGLFVLHGAPDLALTQLLVETVIVVGFVIGLGHLASEFPRVDGTWRAVRIAVSVAFGTAVAVALAAASSKPTGRAPLESLAQGAVDEGGGKNIVNVILTDIRALDTLGEVVVLATVAVGILALARTDDAVKSKGSQT